ncbi:mas-related G-protein coupled receptor member H-like [Dryobates pubescens]|uniref:mas-related G-protein coupled receptor member H-like n=1 Tax=Dryobates pubescens TaxID=118200 RepID=UPI0023B9697C|nr:mas-related G-protein coupled receptor member H-like [Dryobates pubescens]
MDETVTTDLSPTCLTTTYPEPEKSYYFWCKKPRDDILISTGVFACTSVCGLVGNAAVLWLLGFCMKRNPFTVYVLNLAVADCSLLLILLAKFTLDFILWVSCIEEYEWELASAILFPLFLFCYFAGMYLLTAMSVERCLAVWFPAWYRCHRPKHLSGILCGVLWALAAVSILLLILTCVFTESCTEAFKGLSIVHIALFASVPLLSNLALFIRRHPGKLYVAVLLSVLFLAVLGIPFSVETLVSFYYPQEFWESFLLASLNSSINPVISFLVGSCQHCRIQCSIKVACQRLFEEGATSEERSQVPGDAVMETSM